jgi:hypothetical protein
MSFHIPKKLSPPVLIFLFSAGVFFWAKGEDAYRRIWLTLPTTSFGTVRAVCVLPRPVQRRPVVIYISDRGDNLGASGNALRQFADMGFASATFEYDPSNSKIFAEQFDSLLDYIVQQPWADPQAIGCVDLGSRRMLTYFFEHSARRPKVLVLEFLTAPALPENIVNGRNQSTVLLVRRGVEGPATSAQLKVFRSFLAEHDFQSVLWHLGGSPTFDTKNPSVVLRLIGEWSKRRLDQNHPLPEAPEVTGLPFWLCSIPALIWLGCSLLNTGGPMQEIASRSRIDLKPKLVRWRTGSLLLIALLAYGVHLCALFSRTSTVGLAISRAFLVRATWREEFDYLLQLAQCGNQRIGTLITHAELAHYNSYELANWSVPKDIYITYVLSPEIDSGPVNDMDWRRMLWEFFYPRLNTENSIFVAATKLAEIMRSRISIVKTPNVQSLVTIWQKQVANQRDFTRLYVAAARSVGIPARMNSKGVCQIWSEERWLDLTEPKFKEMPEGDMP